MCRRVMCKRCGRPDWRGCGAHVEAVLGDVPEHDRCQCRTEGPPAELAAGVVTKTRWWRG